MALDLDKIAPKARAELIKLGKRYSSDDTLAQAEQTVSGLDKHSDKLAPMGFNDHDTQRLKDARQALIDAGVGREAARTGKKVTNKAYDGAMKTGKAKRTRARSVLSSCKRVLHEHDETDAMNAIDAVLDQTGTAPDDASKLATQLDAYVSALSRADVAKVAKTRGGPALLPELGACAAQLRAVSQDAATVQGTPAETSKLDLIDGIIIGLARDARKAAQAASKELGDPAILAAFELTKLYAPSKGKKDEPPAKEPPVDPAKGEPTVG